MGVVPFLIFLYEASIYTFLDLAHDFFNLFLRSRVGTTPHPCLFKFRFQFQVQFSVWTSFVQETGGGKALNTSS